MDLVDAPWVEGLVTIMNADDMDAMDDARASVTTPLLWSTLTWVVRPMFCMVLNI